MVSGAFPVIFCIVPCNDLAFNLPEPEGMSWSTRSVFVSQQSMGANSHTVCLVQRKQNKGSACDLK